MIVDGKAGPGTAGGDTIAKEIEDGVRDKGIKALVVRVDSPGGSVLASERIRQALLDAKAKKIPVVVSMGSVAASGGYWVATPADFIYAEPSTITGSIGVFGVLPSFQGTLQKLGIGADGVKTTPLSGEPDLLKGPSPEANQLIQSGVECDVRAASSASSPQSRHKTPQQVDQIAQGRVWDGGTAHQLGLVDGFGGMSEAIAKAAELAKLGDERGVRYLEPPPSFRDQLIETLASEDSDDSAVPADAFAMLGGKPQQQLASVHRRGALDPRRARASRRAASNARRSRRRGPAAGHEPARAAQGMAVLIRLARPDDAAAIAAIYRPYVEDSRISFEEAAPDAAEMARRIVGDEPGFHPWLVAEEDGRLLGYRRKLAVPDPRRPIAGASKPASISPPAAHGPRARAKPADRADRAARAAGLRRGDRRDRPAQRGQRRAPREARLLPHRHLSPGRLQDGRVARRRPVAEGAGGADGDARRAAAVRVSRRA